MRASIAIGPNALRDMVSYERSHQCVKRRRAGQLRGALWHQGESDAAEAELGRAYADGLGTWIAELRSDTGMHDLPVVAVQIGRIVGPSDRGGVCPGIDLVREALRSLRERVPHTAVTSAVDLSMVDAFHLDTPSLIRLGARCARVALALSDGRAGAPAVTRCQWRPDPKGARRAVHLRYHGVTGRWRETHDLRGFHAWEPDIGREEPLMAVNGWVETAGKSPGRDLIVLLSKEADERTRLGYGLGPSSVCAFVDGGDMPLCAFLPRTIAAESAV